MLGLAQAEHHGLGPLVDRGTGVIKGILGHIGEHEQIPVPLDALENVLPQAREMGHVDAAVGDQQELGE